ncbi:MAG: S8 family peptidase, partial [Actinomycetota bacterium]|nr:S8 family peptidase [Actinomycetota bacterium]
MASPNTRRNRGIAVLAGLALAITPVAIAHASADRELAPVVGVGAADVIAGRYIVVLDDDTTARTAATTADTARSAGGTVHHTYGTAIRGFSATLPAGALASLRSNVAVDYIEADQRVTLDATQSPVTWGLDRIDQRNLPLSNSYTYTQNGAGITAYIIDTGIRADHADLSGRVGTGYSAIAGGTNDCNGHGTHVAGTVGSETYGVAKDVGLVPVRVLDCNGSGSNSGVIAGVDWVTSNSPGPSVANMSLGGGISSALDTAVRNSVNSGVPYALAAGNSSTNACNTSPARVAEGITVGSTTRTDSVSSFSNQGTCLDIFAPGSDITSTWHTSSTATNTISGTSMAAPHVAGVAALYLQAFPGSTS